jgi:hypothetical protein
LADRLEKDKELVKKSERQIEAACGLSVQTFTPDLSRLRLFSQLQSPVVGERVLTMVVNGKIIAAINEQMGNEFSAMLQYYAIAAYLVPKDCASYLRIFTGRPRRKRSTRCVLSSSSSTRVPA